jgi:alpha 1,3-glucosidase
MDYLNPGARGLYLYENWSRTTPTLGGVCWNDMNEASVFDNDTKKTFPYDLVHYVGVSNRAIHNMYNLLQIMATHKGLEDSDNSTRRPFILTRAHFAGTQHLCCLLDRRQHSRIRLHPHQLLYFFDEPTEELLQRFVQSGAWLWFFREHSNIGSKDVSLICSPKSSRDCCCCCL